MIFLLFHHFKKINSHTEVLEEHYGGLKNAVEEIDHHLREHEERIEGNLNDHEKRLDRHIEKIEKMQENAGERGN